MLICSIIYKCQESRLVSGQDSSLLKPVTSQDVSGQDVNGQDVNDQDVSGQTSAVKTNHKILKIANADFISNLIRAFFLSNSYIGILSVSVFEL